MNNLKRIKNFLYKKTNKSEKIKIIIISVLIFSVVAHAYCWFDFNFSHDSSMMIQNDSMWQISLGRYIHYYYVILRGSLFSPLIVGVLSTIFITLSVYYISKIFNIENRIGLILIAGLLSTNSVITFITATYIFELDIYMLSLLLSVLSVYLCINYKNGWFASILLLSISLGIYQSYWQVGIILFMFSLVKDILDGNKYKTILLKALKYILILIASLVLYYIGMKLTLNYFNISPSNSYNSLQSINNLMNLNKILILIKGAYVEFFNYTLNLKVHNYGIISKLALVSIILSIFIIIKEFPKVRSNKIEFILLLIILMLIPLGGNIVYIIVQGMEHGLMTYSVFIIYVFMIYLLSKNIGSNFKIYNAFIIIFFIMIIFNSIIYSNQIYMKKHIEYEKTYAVLNRIIDKIEQVDNYVLGKTKVLFIGDLQKNNICMKTDYFDYSGTGTESCISVTYMNTYNQFINRIMSYPINVVIDQEIINSYSTREDIKNMKSFPSNEFIKAIDDMIIVKLSD